MRVALPHKGISLVETLVYMAILTVFMIVITKGLYTFASSYRVIRSVKAIENSAIIALDRLAREVRNAGGVSALQSTFSSTGTSSALVLTDSATTTVFRVCGSVLHLYSNGGLSGCSGSGDQGPLTLSGVSVKTFAVQRIATSTRQAVKVDMTLETSANGIAKTKNFHQTVLVRGL